MFKRFLFTNCRLTQKKITVEEILGRNPNASVNRSDSFLNREAASENMYIRELEREKMLKILEEIKRKDNEREENHKAYESLKKIIKKESYEDE